MPGTLIVSLDFELFWGMLDVCPLEEYQSHVLGGRKTIPQLLTLFQKYGIHATWAAVGFLRIPRRSWRSSAPQKSPPIKMRKLPPMNTLPG